MPEARAPWGVAESVICTCRKLFMSNNSRLNSVCWVCQNLLSMDQNRNSIKFLLHGKSWGTKEKCCWARISYVNRQFHNINNHFDPTVVEKAVEGNEHITCKPSLKS